MSEDENECLSKTKKKKDECIKNAGTPENFQFLGEIEGKMIS